MDCSLIVPTHSLQRTCSANLLHERPAVSSHHISVILLSGPGPGEKTQFLMLLRAGSTARRKYNLPTPADRLDLEIGCSVFARLSLLLTPKLLFHTLSVLFSSQTVRRKVAGSTSQRQIFRYNPAFTASSATATQWGQLLKN